MSTKALTCRVNITDTLDFSTNITLYFTLESYIMQLLAGVDTNGNGNDVVMYTSSENIATLQGGSWVFDTTGESTEFFSKFRTLVNKKALDLTILKSDLVLALPYEVNPITNRTVVTSLKAGSIIENISDSSATSFVIPFRSLVTVSTSDPSTLISSVSASDSNAINEVVGILQGRLRYWVNLLTDDDYTKLVTAWKSCIEATLMNPEITYTNEALGGADVKYNVTIDENILNGRVSAEPTSASEGDEIALTIIPNEGYSITTVTAYDNAITATDGAYKFKMKAQDATVMATFTAIEYTITVNNENMTNITVTPSTTMATIGTSITLTVAAIDGYKLSTLKYNDTAIEVADDQTEYTFNMPAQNVTITGTEEVTTPQ